MEGGGGEVYHIGGHKIMFPFKPYPTQFDMMSKIVRGLDRKQNCLLESPTGSGKTLALLCSSLAWQQTEKAKIEAEYYGEEEKNFPCEACRESESEIYNKNYHRDEQNKCDKDPCCVQEVRNDDTLIDTPASYAKRIVSFVVGDDDDDEDFVVVDKQHTSRQKDQKPTKPSRSHVSIEYEMPDQQKNAQTSCSTTNNKKECTCHCKEKDEGPTHKKKLPTIFFGSRTHKQLKQVIKELKQSQYKDVNMTLLASRDHTCINPSVKTLPSITEGCKNLLENGYCRFNAKSKTFNTQRHIRSVGLSEAWDIEDLVKVCSKKKVAVCPYFLSRSLILQSDIVFCPYNYFIDPIIRQSVGIELDKNIIIVDEAHNIEGSCREATSFSITKTAFKVLRDEIDKLLKYKQNLEEYGILMNLANQCIFLIDKYSNQLQQKDFNQSCKIWSGFDIVAQMESIDFGPKEYVSILKRYKSLCVDVDKRKEKNQKALSLPSPSLTMLENLFIIMGFFYGNELKNVEDFRMAIVKSVNAFQGGQGGKRRKSAPPMFPVQELSIHLWCMNPGVAFGDFHETHSVILTSGTLSPMISFQSELQMPFQICMEGRHIVAPSQVWVGTIGSGPSGKQLRATYKFTETYLFQDELGGVVLDVCLKVPNGVLCFLSSYSFLDKLTKRWQTTGLWDKILKRKAIVTEPRSGKKEVFEKIWQQFLEYAEGRFPSEDDSPEEGDEEKKEGDEEEEDDFVKKAKEEDLRDGALFLCVCRGKLSEGTDFANNSARAVITVGIPYPYVNDVQIGLKKDYNEKHKKTRQLLSGSEWFEIQAYRALNQALGRCIRHKDDWGAIILVDDRFFQGERYLKGLSKWVRGMLKPQYNYYAAMNSLEQFTKNKNNGDNLAEVGPEQTILDTNMTMMNVNILKNLCSDTPGPSTSHGEPLITSTPLVEPHIKPLMALTSNLTLVEPHIKPLMASTPFVDPHIKPLMASTQLVEPHIKPFMASTGHIEPEPHIVSISHIEPLITSTPHIEPLITSMPHIEPLITSTPLNKNEFSDNRESKKSSDFFPVTLNGISIIPKIAEGFPDKMETNQSECSTIFPINSEFGNISSVTPRSLKKGNGKKLNFEKLKNYNCKTLDSTVEPVDQSATELELSNTQLVDETLKSEAFSSETNLVRKPVSHFEKAADIESKDKPDPESDRESSPGLFSNSDSDILSMDESYLDGLSRTVVTKTPPSKKPAQVSSDGDNDLLSYIENESVRTSPKAKCSTRSDTRVGTLDVDTELLSSVESKAENLSAFTAEKSKSLSELPDSDMNDEDLLSFVVNEESKEENQKESQEKENTDSKQMLSRRPLFKTSLKPSSSLVNPVPSCIVRTAPKRTGCEDVFFIEEEEEEDFGSLKTKRSMNRKKRQCTGDSNMPRKKVKGVVFEENTEVICRLCQKTLLSVDQIIERRPIIPPFLLKAFTNNYDSKELLFINCKKSFCEGLADLMPVTSHNGVLLNSGWFPDLDCCVQYLHCPTCEAKRSGKLQRPWIIGAKVVIGTKEYTTGQVWLSQSAVKINHGHQ